jgi:hypothetical protein
VRRFSQNNIALPSNTFSSGPVAINQHFLVVYNGEQAASCVQKQA